MQAFTPVPGGFACGLEPAERQILARVVADTAELLGTRLEARGRHAAGPEAGPEPVGPDPAPAEDEDEVDGEAALLAALDWQPGGEETPQDPALARLLPPASVDDADLAAEMRRLTEGTLRSGKVERLRRVWSTLRRSSGVVIVRHGEESDWLAALTDVRLVVAARLGIEDDEDAEAVYERAGADDDDGGFESALAGLYAALTWWQESLLAALSAPQGEG